VPRHAAEKKYKLRISMNPYLIEIKNPSSSLPSTRKKHRESVKIGVHTTSVLAILCLGFLTLYYVWILNMNATKGYEIRTLEIARNNLIVEKELLEIKISQLESLSTLAKWNGIKDMEKVEHIDFLVVKDLWEYAFNYTSKSEKPN